MGSPWKTQEGVVVFNTGRRDGDKLSGRGVEIENTEYADRHTRKTVMMTTNILYTYSGLVFPINYMDIKSPGWKFSSLVSSVLFDSGQNSRNSD